MNVGIHKVALQIAFNILLEPRERLPHSIFQPILPQLLQLVSILFFQKYVLANMSAAIEQFTQPNVQRQTICSEGLYHVFRQVLEMTKSKMGQ